MGSLNEGLPLHPARDPVFLAGRRALLAGVVPRASPAVSAAVARRSRLDQLRARRPRLRRRRSTSPIRPAIRCSSWRRRRCTAIGLSEVHALSLLGVLGGALAVFGCFALLRANGESSITSADGRPDAGLAGRVARGVTCPLYWLTAARPLSDAAGLAAALAIQALTPDRAVRQAPLALAAALRRSRRRHALAGGVADAAASRARHAAAAVAAADGARLARAALAYVAWRSSGRPAR